MKKKTSQIAGILLTGLLLMSASACGKQADTDKNLVKDSNNVKRTVNMFTPVSYTHLLWRNPIPTRTIPRERLRS